MSIVNASQISYGTLPTLASQWNIWALTVSGAACRPTGFQRSGTACVGLLLSVPNKYTHTHKQIPRAPLPSLGLFVQATKGYL